MALADWFSLKSPLHLEGDGVRLRPFRAADYREWAELRLRSRDFLQPWEPLWPADDLTYGGFKRRMAAYQREVDLSVGYPFLIFRESDGAMVGGVSLSNVRRGVAMMGTVGYWCGADFARSGYTLSGVRAVADFAFRRLDLHRIEAACVPENEPSRRLLLKAGFKQEGLASAYLKINGVWRDHLTFGLLANDFRETEAVTIAP
jgi:ribosomal-protein-alanine N-acetyltransferase